MGLIKAALGAAGGVMADQWKEFFYCEAIPADVLAVKGKKKATGRSSNTKGDDNIITNGSVIAVANGQCRALDLIETEADKVLHAHGVGGTAFVVALTVYTLGDLHILYLHGGDADTLMYRDRAPHTDGHAFCVLKRKYLAERTYVQPCFTGLLCIVF